MRILITGAFGYLGGRVARGLLRLGHEVILTDKTIPAWAGVLGPEQRQFRLDVLGPELGPEVFHGVDVVVLLAALDENEAVKNPERALLVSGEGTRRTLDAAHLAGVRTALFLSTLHVYGPSAPAVLCEAAPTRPAHPYAIAHVAGEGYAFAANQRAGRPFARVIRFSNGYGAPVHPAVQRWTLAHNDFCLQAFTTGRIVLKTHGRQHRDFVWLEDLVAALDILGTAADHACADPVFHVGGECSLSVRRLAQQVAQRAGARLGRDIPIEGPPPGPDDREAPVRFDITRIKGLGYQPRNGVDRETDTLLELLEAARW